MLEGSVKKVAIALNSGRPRKKFRRQGEQILRNEAYLCVRRNDEGCSSTQHPDFFRGRHA